MTSWTGICALALGPAVSNGFARFSYALVLPAMKSDLDWGYADAGWINTANALGYLLGAILALRLSATVSPVKLFTGGMIVTTLALLFSGYTADFYLLSAMRLLAGLGGAPVFIAGAALAANAWPQDAAKNALAIAIYFGGGGIGILLSALLLPVMIDQWGVNSWPYTWIVMGGLSIVACLLTIRMTRELSPAAPVTLQRQTRLPIYRLWASLLAYFLFAVGYVVYMTFIIAWLQEQGANVVTVILCWSLLGIGVMASPFPWRRLLARYSNGIPLASACLCTAVGSTLPLLFHGITGILFSASIFGLAFFIAPTAVTAFAKKNLPSQKWGAAVALYTIVFAVGQTLGPIGAGWLSDRTGNLDWGLMAGSIILFLAAAVALAQRTISEASQVTHPQ